MAAEVQPLQPSRREGHPVDSTATRRRKATSAPPTRPRRVRPAHQPDDHALIARCLLRDEAAWNILVDRYENLVWSTALDVGLDRDDVRDVFQHTWMELHRSLPRIRSTSAIPVWLIVTTRRHAYKIARQRQRWGEELSQELTDPASLPDEDLVAIEQRRSLEIALSQMQEADAELLRLLFLHHPKLSYEDISARTGLAVGSIGPIRARCFQRLRKILEEQS